MVCVRTVCAMPEQVREAPAAPAKWRLRRARRTRFLTGPGGASSENFQ